jgi:hypothetical protein
MVIGPWYGAPKVVDFLHLLLFLLLFNLSALRMFVRLQIFLVAIQPV